MKTRTSAVVASIVIVATAAIGWAGRPRQNAKPEDVIIVGRIVDLHTYMSGAAASDDPTKDTRDNLRGGVPAGLEIEDGIVVIGMGKQNPARKLLPMAYKEVEVTGKLYDKDGLLYIDMQEIKVVGAEGAHEGEAHPEQPGQPAPPQDDGQ